MDADLTLFNNYVLGRSMLPTFSSADQVQIASYASRKEIKRGDIIVFCHPGNKKTIIHRVISCAGDRFMTQGDNNPSADEQAITFEDVIGRVVMVKIGSKTRRVLGGMSGHVYGIMVRSYCRMFRRAASFFLYPYRFLAGTKILKRVFRPFLKYSIFYFDKPGQEEFQLAINGFMVGRYIPSKDKIYVKPPFKLILDETRFSCLSK